MSVGIDLGGVGRLIGLLVERGEELVASDDRDPVDAARPLDHVRVDDGEGRGEARQDLVQPLVVEAVVDGANGTPASAEPNSSSGTASEFTPTRVALPAPVRRSTARGPTGPAQQVAVGPPAVTRAHADAIRAGLGGHLEEHCRVHRNLRVSGRGATAVLARGPRTHPHGGERASR